VGNRASALGREILKLTTRLAYNPRRQRESRQKTGMKLAVVKVLLIAMTLAAATSVYAQTRHRREREPKEAERPAPAVSVDKRDTIVPPPGAFSGRPYWLALAQCGGIYFKLNVFYTAVAVQARAVKPDPKLNSEYTQKLNDAIKTATAFFSGAEHFLMTDRNLERIDAVLIYDEQSRAAADRVKSVEAGLSAAKVCPALYEACQKGFAKACNESLAPMG
jgi:hypothetical protein